jgi:hypothetical protein
VPVRLQLPYDAAPAGSHTVYFSIGAEGGCPRVGEVLILGSAIAEGVAEEISSAHIATSDVRTFQEDVSLTSSLQHEFPSIVAYSWIFDQSVEDNRIQAMFRAHSALAHFFGP